MRFGFVVNLVTIICVVSLWALSSEAASVDIISGQPKIVYGMSITHSRLRDESSS